jgi:hypothetical protein
MRIPILSDSCLRTGQWNPNFPEKLRHSRSKLHKTRVAPVVLKGSCGRQKAIVNETAAIMHITPSPGSRRN